MAPASLFLLLLYVASSCAATADDSLTAYWNQKITNSLPKPLTLFSQASPMSADAAAMFAQMIADGTISDHLLTFCKEAHLACSFNADFPQPEYPDSPQPETVYADVATGVHSEKEAGIFFPESALKMGNVLRLPDISNNMPKRSFLPHIAASKLSFSISKLTKLNQIFQAKKNSPLGKILAHAVARCESPAIDGETKSCVSSIEDMIDFATANLGSDVMVLSTKSTGGSKEEVVVGQVKKMENNYGTKPVVCHQIMFPSVTYYCHSFMNVQIYEVDILDRNSRAQINQAVAICHFNTSTLNPKRPAFLDLKSGPGLIGVCHWIKEKNIIWKAI